MNKLVLRQIFQQIHILHTKEYRLAEYLKSILRQRYFQQLQQKLHYKNNIHLNRQLELMQAFLAFLKQLNASNTYAAQQSKKKLIGIFANIDPYVDDSFQFRTDNLPNWQIVLNTYPQFLSLPKDKDKQFVIKVLTKLFQKQSNQFDYNDLSGYLRDVKSKTSTLSVEKALECCREEVREYIQQVLRGQNTSQVDTQYRSIYQSIFRASQLSPVQRVLNCYLESNYILIDFDQLNLKKQ